MILLIVISVKKPDMIENKLYPEASRVMNGLSNFIRELTE